MSQGDCNYCAAPQLKGAVTHEALASKMGATAKLRTYGTLTHTCTAYMRLCPDEYSHSVQTPTTRTGHYYYLYRYRAKVSSTQDSGVKNTDKLPARD